MYICMCIYIYIYTYIFVFGVLVEPTPSTQTARKGTNGVSTNGVAANFMVFDRGAFLGTPVNLLLYSQKFQGVTFFPNLSKVITFAVAPLVFDPICPQTKAICLWTMCFLGLAAWT